MFSIQLSRIPKQGSLNEEKMISPAELGLTPPFGTQEVTAAYELSFAGKNVLARNRASAGALLQCGRCLKPFQQPVSVSFLVEFEHEEGSTRLGGKALAEELQRYSVVLFAGDAVPLGEEFRQELELALPHNPLCRQDCKGLCPTCGADLNLGACSCPPQIVPGPLSALKDYWTESKEKKHG